MIRRPAILAIPALAALLSIPSFAADPAETAPPQQAMQDQGSTPCNCCVQCRAAHRNGAAEQPMAEPCRDCCRKCGMKTPLDDELPADIRPPENPRPLR